MSEIASEEAKFTLSSILHPKTSETLPGAQLLDWSSVSFLTAITGSVAVIFSIKLDIGFWLVQTEMNLRQAVSYLWAFFICFLQALFFAISFMVPLSLGQFSFLGEGSLDDKHLCISEYFRVYAVRISRSSAA